MPSLTDDTLVRFPDRQALLEHVMKRGRARRRRLLQARVAVGAVVLLVAIAPLVVLVGDRAASVRTTPPAGNAPPTRAPEGGSATGVEPRAEAVATDEAGTEGSQASGTGAPEGGVQPETSGSAPPASTTSTTSAGAHPKSECTINNASAGDGGVFVGENPCHFTARQPGGYEALGEWEIIVTRGEETITYSAAKGSPSCGPTGTFQPGDGVEVRVARGRASAGPSAGTDC